MLPVQHQRASKFTKILQGTFQSVTATFVLPTPADPPGTSGGAYAAAAWVGIDGDTCPTAILQTGVDMIIQNGEVSYNGT